MKLSKAEIDALVQIGDEWRNFRDILYRVNGPKESGLFNSSKFKQVLDGLYAKKILDRRSTENRRFIVNGFKEDFFQYRRRR